MGSNLNAQLLGGIFILSLPRIVQIACHVAGLLSTGHLRTGGYNLQKTLSPALFPRLFNLPSISGMCVASSLKKFIPLFSVAAKALHQLLSAKWAVQFYSTAVQKHPSHLETPPATNAC